MDESLIGSRVFFWNVRACGGLVFVHKDSVPVVCERCDGLMLGCIVSDVVERLQEEDLSGGL
jgi:hypothetical protein